MNPGKPHELAAQILDAVRDYYADAELPLPERQYVCDGLAPAFDCEQVVVACESLFGHEGDVAFPLVTSIGCVFLNGLQVSVWIVRCTPTVDDAGTPPTPEAIETAAQAVLADPVLAMNAVLEANNVGLIGGGSRTIVYSGTTWPGPEGGLSSSKLTLRVDLTNVLPATS